MKNPWSLEVQVVLSRVKPGVEKDCSIPVYSNKIVVTLYVYDIVKLIDLAFMHIELCALWIHGIGLFVIVLIVHLLVHAHFRFIHTTFLILLLSRSLLAWFFSILWWMIWLWLYGDYYIMGCIHPLLYFLCTLVIFIFVFFFFFSITTAWKLLIIIGLLNNNVFHFYITFLKLGVCYWMNLSSFFNLRINNIVLRCFLNLRSLELFGVLFATELSYFVRVFSLPSSKIVWLLILSILTFVVICLLWQFLREFFIESLLSFFKLLFWCILVRMLCLLILRSYISIWRVCHLVLNEFTHV